MANAVVEQVCDECARLFQLHIPRWTKDGVFFYCGHCKGAMGGEGWRQAEWDEAPQSPEEAPDPEPEKPHETCAEFLERMGGKYAPRMERRDADQPDTAGLVLNFQPMRKEVKKHMPKKGQPWSEEAKRKLRERRKARANGSDNGGMNVDLIPAAPEPSPYKQRMATRRAAAEATPAGDGRYAIAEILDLINRLRAIAPADRAILFEMI